MRPGDLRVTDVRTRVASFSGPTWLDRTRISTPMAAYPAFAEQRSTWRGPGAELVWVLVRTQDPDVFGIGQTRGGAVIDSMLTAHLLPLLRDLDPRAPEAVSELLRRAAAPYAAGGVTELAVSAIELALWDLSARACGVPLYRLLGGQPGPIPYYLTAAHPDVLDGLAVDLIADAHYVKVPMAYGPADGPAHLTDNLDRLAAARDRVPAHVPLAVDCFMSWDLAYTLRFAAEAAPFGLGWIEEPLPPDDLAGLARLRARLPAGVRVAAGEHAFGLGAGLRLVHEQAVDVLQSDLTWCGGLAVARTLAAVARQHGMLFAPHAAASQPWALHLLNATRPGGVAEVLIGVDSDPRPPAVADGPGVGIDPGEVGLR